MADPDFGLGYEPTMQSIQTSKSRRQIRRIEFLERMQGSIKQWVGEQSARPQPAARPSRRALLLTGAAGIAAGVAAVVGIEQLTEPAPKTARPLVENGRWKPVKALADLPEGTPMAFRSGAIEGFLTRNGNQVAALSAVCTHMGCILNYSKFRDRFECPCHGATFEKDGHPTNYSSPLSPLPSLQVRVENGQVEVYTV